MSQRESDRIAVRLAGRSEEQAHPALPAAPLLSKGMPRGRWRMDSGGPEQRLAEFLAVKPSWLRKVLQHDYALTTEEQAELASVNWPEVYGQALDEYFELLRECPARLREYRKGAEKHGAQNALFGVPRVPEGAPRKEWLAQECWDLQQAGMSQPEIARELNLRHPNLKDKKGNPRPINEEVVRKQLASLRKKSPGKNSL
jgi:hypothetical protein